jgi:hypothetical protein
MAMRPLWTVSFESKEMGAGLDKMAVAVAVDMPPLVLQAAAVHCSLSENGRCRRPRLQRPGIWRRARIKPVGSWYAVCTLGCTVYCCDDQDFRNAERYGPAGLAMAGCRLSRNGVGRETRNRRKAFKREVCADCTDLFDWLRRMLMLRLESLPRSYMASKSCGRTGLNMRFPFNGPCNLALTAALAAVGTPILGPHLSLVTSTIKFYRSPRHPPQPQVLFSIASPLLH